MALTLEDADRMISACAEHDVRLFVVKQNRFNVPIQRVRQAVDAGRLGRLVMGTVRVRWCRDQGYYDQDAWRGTWAQDGGVLANQASHHIDVLEWMTTATRPKDLEGSLSLLGELGSIEVGGFALNELKTWNFVNPTSDDATVLAEYSVNPPDVYGFGHRLYLEHVVECLRTDAPQLVDGQEGRRSLELILAIYESIETGREISLKFQPRHSRLGMTS